MIRKKTLTKPKLADNVSNIDKLYGSLKFAWGKNSDKYLRKLRDKADRKRG